MSLLARRLQTVSVREVAPYVAEVTGDGPWSWWRLEETSGSTVADKQGRNNGTVSGANLNVAGQVGSAASFDGSNDYIDCGTSLRGELNGTALSLEAWIKTSADGAIMTLENDGTTAAERSFQFRVVSGVVYFVKIPNGVVSATGTTDLRDGLWHHVAATYDGTTIRVYADGTEEGTAAATGSTIGTATTKFIIGANGRVLPSNPFSGPIDEPAVYTKVLTATEVSDHNTVGRA